jgi:hypothetical protein
MSVVGDKNATETSADVRYHQRNEMYGQIILLPILQQREPYDAEIYCLYVDHSFSFLKMVSLRFLTTLFFSLCTISFLSRCILLFSSQECYINFNLVITPIFVFRLFSLIRVFSIYPSAIHVILHFRVGCCVCNS